MRLQELLDKSEVRNLTVHPGEALAIALPESMANITDRQASEIRERVRASFQFPVPILIIPWGWDIAVISEENL